MRLQLDREKIVPVLNGLRRVLVRSVIVAGALSIISFFFARNLLLFLVNHVRVQLYWFNLSEVLFSTVEIAIYTGLFLAVPVMLVLAWREFRPLLGGKISRAYLFVIFSIFLFYLGSVFCYIVVLPSGVGFLLSFQGGAIKAAISTQRFVNFCTGMVFAFGAAFELPILLLILGRLGIVTSRTLSRTRRYAVLVIVIVSAVITPTPDIYNLSLLAVPLYILYEVGIILMRMGERNLTEKAKSV